MAATSNISAVFNAVSGPFDKGTKRIVAGMNSITKSAKKTGSTLSTLRNIEVFRLLSSGIRSAYFQVSKLVRAFDTVAGSIDKSAKVARTLGLSFGGYESLALVFRESGVEATLAEAMIAKLLRRVGEARKGGKFAVNAFKAIGISLEELQTISEEDIFKRTIQGLNELGDAFETQRVAQLLFEETGARLGSVIAKGAAGFEEAAKVVKAFGLVLRTGQFKAVEELNDNINRAKLSVQGLFRQVVANLAPAISAVANTWNEWVQSIGAETLGKNLATNMMQAVIAAADWYDSINLGVQDVIDALRKLYNLSKDVDKTLKIPQAAGEAAFKSRAAWAASLDATVYEVGNFFGIVSKETLKVQQERKKYTAELNRAAQDKLTSLYTKTEDVVVALSEIGPAGKLMREALEKMLANLDSAYKDQKDQAPEIASAISTAISSKLASIDARSQEGVNFVLAQTTQRRQTIEQQQLQVLRKIEQHTKAEGTAPDRNVLIYAIP